MCVRTCTRVHARARTRTHTCVYARGCYARYTVTSLILKGFFVTPRARSVTTGRFLTGFDGCVTLPGQRNRPVQNLVQRGTETGLDKQVGVTRSLGGEPDLRHAAARAPQRGIMSGDPVGVGAVDSWSWHWWWSPHKWPQERRKEARTTMEPSGR